MTFLSRIPYTPPPYEAMKPSLMEGTTEAMYNSSVTNVAALTGMTVSSIRYESDGLAVTGIEVLPDLTPDARIPLLIYNRGGSGDYGVLSPGQVSVLMAPFARALHMGVLASNYRGNGGSEGKDEFGGADVRDVLRLLELGKQQPWWDGKNIFMLGWSRGGMMTYLALKAGAVVNAAAVGAGVADLIAGNARRPEMETIAAKYIADYATNRDGALRERSAVCWPEKINAPLLVMHGDADDKVHVSEARDLVAKLQVLDKPLRYVEYADGNHALKRHWKQWVDEVVRWFETNRIL